MSRRSSQQGYSLVELLVVLALMGMIAVAMASGIRFGGRVWEKTGHQVESIDSVTGAQDMLRTLLQRVVPRDLDPGIPHDPDMFRGDTMHASFTANSPAAIDTNGVARFELLSVQRNGKMSLVLQWIPVSGPRSVQSAELVSGADEIRIVYASLDQTGVFVWHDNWNDQSGVPALISIAVRFPPQSLMVWPEFDVRPRVVREPTCIYDAVSFGCRHA